MTIEELIKKIQRECENEPENKFHHQWEANRWEKYGKDRLYINRTNGRNNKSQGFVNLNDISADDLDITNIDLNKRIKEIIEQYKEAN